MAVAQMTEAGAKYALCVILGTGPNLNYYTQKLLYLAEDAIQIVQEISLSNAKRLLCNPGNCWLAAIILLAAELVLNTVIDLGHDVKWSMTTIVLT